MSHKRKAEEGVDVEESATKKIKLIDISDVKVKIATWSSFALQ